MDVEPKLALRDDRNRKEENMKMAKLELAIMAGILGLVVQAHATLFDIAFDIQGNEGSGTLTASAIGGANYLVTSASVYVTEGNWRSATAYILAPNNYNYGTFGTYGQSSEGHFAGGEDLIYDNILYANSTPLLDNDGLAFWTTSGTAGFGLNLWGNSGATDYTFAGAGGFGGPVLTGGTVSITSAVPEPTTIISGALLLLPFGASTLRILRRNRAA